MASFLRHLLYTLLHKYEQSKLSLPMSPFTATNINIGKKDYEMFLALHPEVPFKKLYGASFTQVLDHDKSKTFSGCKPSFTMHPNSLQFRCLFPILHKARFEICNKKDLILSVHVLDNSYFRNYKM